MLWELQFVFPLLLAFVWKGFKIKSNRSKNAKTQLDRADQLWQMSKQIKIVQYCLAQYRVSVVVPREIRLFINNLPGVMKINTTPVDIILRPLSDSFERINCSNYNSTNTKKRCKRGLERSAISIYLCSLWNVQLFRYREDKQDLC